MNYSFTRYLAAKKTIDDRSLNRLVWEGLANLLSELPKPVRILEVGAGTGAMLERLLDKKLLGNTEYIGIDAQAENIAFALQHLPTWGENYGYQVEQVDHDRFYLSRPSELISVQFEAVELFEYLIRANRPPADLLVACAFLDLLDIPTSLPRIFSLLRPGGLFYFSINFDGLTIFEPQIDADLDERIIALYHLSMDERQVAGKVSGDSKAGRRLFQNLAVVGGEIIEAGASDWVIYPRRGAYPGDEAYFLHHIIHFFEETLQGNPELDPVRFASWLAERHAQIEAGKLIYIAHQLDFIGRRPD